MSNDSVVRWFKLILKHLEVICSLGWVYSDLKSFKLTMVHIWSSWPWNADLMISTTWKCILWLICILGFYSKSVILVLGTCSRIGVFDVLTMN